MQTKTMMKGQALTIGAIPAIVLTFVLIGFYLSFGLLLLEDSETLTTITQQINNETNTFRYGTPYTTGNIPLLSIVELRNQTLIITPGNYTVSGNTVTLSDTFVINSTPQNFTNNLTVNTSEGQVIQVIEGYNRNNGTRYTAGNFTVFANGGTYSKINYTAGSPARNTLVNLTWQYARYNNTQLNVTYIYSLGTMATNATQNAQQGLLVFANRLPLLALVILFAVILSVIAVLAATGRIQV